jgi:hypothetical protein
MYAAGIRRLNGPADFVDFQYDPRNVGFVQLLAAAMPLRYRLESQSETVQDFELAAEQRYWAGVELIVSGYPGSGVYLIGYTGEMLLKNACFRLDGVHPADLVAPLLGPARTWMRIRCPTIPHESYHSLLFWMWCLREKRRTQGRALSGPLDWALVRRVRRLYQIWWVEMRYRPDQVRPAEAQRAYDDVTWLRDNYLALWR